MVLEQLTRLDMCLSYIKWKPEVYEAKDNYISCLEKENVQLKNSSKILLELLDKKHKAWHNHS